MSLKYQYHENICQVLDHVKDQYKASWITEDNAGYDASVGPKAFHSSFDDDSLM